MHLASLKCKEEKLRASLWGAGQPFDPLDEGLHEAFARVATTQPDAVALVSGNRTISYRELNRRADAWAGALVTRGVAPGARVAILLPRSIELVTTLLAVLKSGAAYALLDPAWPAARVREMIEQLGARLSIVANDIPAGHAVPVRSLPSEDLACAPAFRPVAVRGSDPCCIFFTSGTTGRPKGVLTPHRATARLFQRDGFASFSRETVMPLAAATPWDAFSLELWGVLLHGGVSVIVDEPYLTGTELRECVSRHGVDTTWLTSSLFNMIVDEDLDTFDGLRQVLVGGERLSPAHVERFLRRHPSIVLTNGYGPVESTIFTTTHRVCLSDCGRPGGIPIGRPVPGTGVHILDGAQFCDDGEIGEIYVTGDGLALGYLGEDALNRTKFTTIEVDGRMVRAYRTGDLAMRCPDGLLHYRGRTDRQLKIRGHRVEPAEVERQIEQLLPGVQTCRVLARRDEGGAPRDLIAFCIATHPQRSFERARQVLSSAMAAHHCPTEIVVVSAFPLTAQGKLDEQALLATARLSATRDAPTAATDDWGDKDATRHAVLEIFEAVLGRHAVSTGLSFFDLGGTSLDAGRACVRLSARFGRPIPVSWLYRHPTIASLADALRLDERSAITAHASAGAETPLRPTQLMFLTRHLGHPDERTSHCLMVWLMEGKLDVAALEAAIDEINRRHEPLRTAYLLEPRPTARVLDLPAPPLEMLPGQPSIDAALQRLCAELACELSPIDADVWRVALVPVDTGMISLFGCVVHHVAFDGWSQSVFANDLAETYNAAHAGEPLVATAIQIQQYLNISGSGSDPELELRRMVEELSDVPEITWPTGATAPPPCAPGRIEAPLPSVLLARVDAVAAKAGVTRFVVLLTAWARSLAQTTGQSDFAIGVPVRQRHGANMDGVIGCHINILCVRLRGAALADSESALRQVGCIVHQALARQDVPFADILRRMKLRPSNRPPLFQTLFALQDNPVPYLRLAGLRTTFLRQPYLDLPLELHAEFWPDDAGGVRMETSFRLDVVPQAVAGELVRHFLDGLDMMTRMAPP
jgi:mycobactin peptide synthetase MbtE